ncbi:methyltransferase domain-containing protein [Hymenobacter cellulosilyticus]|uniref:Arsenite methyltransferase n=1 Tax=Hymenobacter cellulosilyticus TaxID=2932248 RepID=A0A8T9Q2A9_9BACT|nr:methyltransferase domain-containing protein [Hymenobacter cellulosilyticus]UOQ69968.1 methyltransferase domain-containing protein [Hymenobacter cellulosilyticus]
MEQHIQAQVQDYYGTELQSSNDLKTNACCTDDIPAAHKRILAQLESEVLEKYYGCGVCIPSAVEGLTVLDLGSGSGRDAYLLSKLVGEQGRVIGVDMTEEQLAVARRHVATHTERFGYQQPNVEFRHGFIEDLHSAGLANNSVDLVVSNCVLNLSTDKAATYREIFRVLKPGGELFIADVFSDRRVPEALRQDPVLYGECLSGALYIEDFRRLLRELGIRDYRLTAQRRLTIGNAEIERKVGNIKFYSLTVRAFKLDLEDQCEDYGQVATYLGTSPTSPTVLP